MPDIVYCRAKVKLDAIRTPVFLWSSRELDYDLTVLQDDKEIDETFFWEEPDGTKRMRPVAYQKKKNKKAVYPILCPTLMHAKDVIIPMRPNHNLSLQKLFLPYKKAVNDVIKSIKGHLGRHVPERARRLSPLGLDGLNDKEWDTGVHAIAQRIVQHAMAKGTLSYIETGNSRVVVKDKKDDKRWQQWQQKVVEARKTGNPEPPEPERAVKYAKRSFNFIVKIQPAELKRITGIDPLPTQPFFMKLVFGWYDDPLPLYENRQVDDAEFAKEARAIYSRLTEKQRLPASTLISEKQLAREKQYRFLYNRFLEQKSRLESGEIRFPNAALLAIGQDPILEPLSPDQDIPDNIDLFPGFDYAKLTPEERLIAMLHSYRFVSVGSRLHLCTILFFTKNLGGAPRIVYDSTAEMARQNGLNIIDYTELFTQGFKSDESSIP